MAGENQERFEDYEQLEQYIEDLQVERPARLPVHLTPEQARVYGMASFFRAASSSQIDPRPEFAAELAARLNNLVPDQTTRPSSMPVNGQFPPELNEPTIRLTDRHRGKGMPAQSPPGIVALPQDSPGQQTPPTKKRRVSRRALFTGGAVAAASLAGATAGALITQNTQPVPADPGKWPPLVDGIPVTWHATTSRTTLGSNAVKFVTESVVGYVIHDEESDEIIAFSAACTHMGCIVGWNGDQRRFDCPCHGGRFTASGKPDNSGKLAYLRSLPRLTVRVEGDQVYVAVPEQEV